ncbi:hypothetical protein FQN52_003702 [Onygenales sp. PD_12]|nr:hypothetical protein FQN52_003702 [Onygenales sp. PD_12]
MARPTPAPAPASDTPPKRVTRARAARTTETSDIPAAKPSQKDTVAGKPAAAGRGRPRTKTATPAPTTKPTTRTRKVEAAETVEAKKQPVKRGRAKKVQEEITAADGDSSEDEMDIMTVSVRGRPKGSTVQNKSSVTSKPAPARAKRAPVTAQKGGDESIISEDDDDDDDELAQPEVPKQRATKVKSTSTTVRRGRPRATETSTTKAPAKRSRKATTMTTEDEKNGHRRTIHISAGSLAASSASARAKTTASGAPKKKVTFLDMATDSDKENQPIPATATDASKNKIQLGLKAKPVRKTAASPVKKSEVDSTQDAKKEPLSPKKATQVARSGSSANSNDDGEDDELGSPGPRIARLSVSPIKRDTRGPFDSPVRKIDFVSPTKSTSRGLALAHSIQGKEAGPSEQSLAPMPNDSVMMASPARKLPASPFKLSMKDSPRRAPIQCGIMESNPELEPSTKTSPLKISPKKGNFGVSFSQFPFNTASSPSKEKPTLLKSPAKRPPSPIKFLPVEGARPEAPSQGIAYDLGSEESPLCDAEGSALPGSFRGSTNASSNGINTEPTEDDIFMDDAVDFEMSVLDVCQPLPPSAEDSCYPVVEEESDLELLKAPELDIDDPFIVTEMTSAPSSPVTNHDIINPDDSTSSVRSYRGIPPAAPSPPVFTAANPAKFMYRDGMFDESEDELMEDSSPTKFNSAQSRRQTLFAEPTTTFEANEDETSEEKLGFTPLAEKLSRWKSTSPVKRRSARVQSRGIFSPVKRSEPIAEAEPRPIIEDNELSDKRQSLAIRQSLKRHSTTPTFFNDEMVVRQRQSTADTIPPREITSTSFVSDEMRDHTMMDTDALDDAELVSGMQEDMYDEEDVYNDENAAPSESTIPIDPQLFDEAENTPASVEQTENSTPLPMSVTPVRSGSIYPRTIHTVSKVPLRSDGDGSTLKVPRKRSRSLSSTQRSPTPSLGKSKSFPSISPRKAKVALKKWVEENAADENEPGPSEKSPIKYSTSTWPPPAAKSPTKSPRKIKPSTGQVLQGAVVYTDVHTAEGADASGIFVELLTQMGARCVKSWSWNPRSSLSPVDGVDPKEGKVGITHVVFKDGGVRTLEKVREANGVVKCVGVGWVLDCERKSKWLDESEYGVDVSFVPRGGQKRRKSMEPRALSNMNGSIIKLDSSTSSSSGRRSGADRETFQELMRLSPTPSSSRRDSMEWERASPTPQPQEKQHFAIQSTPTNPSRISDFQQTSHAQSPATPDFNYTFDFDDASAPSPITPYYPSQGSKLIQQTCPPKQSRQGLFSDSGRAGGEMSEGLKIRLEAARRKSLVWKPKIGSPLGR